MQLEGWNSASLAFRALLIVLLLQGCRQEASQAGPGRRTVQRTWQETVVRELAARGHLETERLAEVREIVQPMVLQSRYQGCFGVNEAFRVGCLSIFVLKSHPPSLGDDVCGYAGMDTIICEREFLTGFLDQSGALEHVPAEQRESFRRSFTRWVLGHELGHADLNHKQGHFLSARMPAAQVEARQGHRLELAADRRFLELSTAADNSVLQGMLVAVFRASYLARYGTEEHRTDVLGFDAEDANQYPYLLDGSHPHMTIRSALLLAITGDTPAAQEATRFVGRTAAPGLLQELQSR